MTSRFKLTQFVYYFTNDVGFFWGGGGWGVCLNALMRLLYLFVCFTLALVVLLIATKISTKYFGLVSINYDSFCR